MIIKFITSVSTSGKLDNGNPWNSKVLFVSCHQDKNSPPFSGKVYKADSALIDPKPGVFFSPFFNEKGKVIGYDII